MPKKNLAVQWCPKMDYDHFCTRMKCSYAHSEEELKKNRKGYRKQECPFLLKGQKCVRGAKFCYYAHNREQWCPELKGRGTCSRRQCPFSHSEEEMKICRKRYKSQFCPDRPNCSEGRFCYWAHDVTELSFGSGNASAPTEDQPNDEAFLAGYFENEAAPVPEPPSAPPPSIPNSTVLTPPIGPPPLLTTLPVAAPSPVNFPPLNYVVLENKFGPPANFGPRAPAPAFPAPPIVIYAAPHLPEIPSRNVAVDGRPTSRGSAKERSLSPRSQFIAETGKKSSKSLIPRKSSSSERSRSRSRSRSLRRSRSRSRPRSISRSRSRSRSWSKPNRGLRGRSRDGSAKRYRLKSNERRKSGPGDGPTVRQKDFSKDEPSRSTTDPRRSDDNALDTWNMVRSKLRKLGSGSSDEVDDKVETSSRDRSARHSRESRDFRGKKSSSSRRQSSPSTKDVRRSTKSDGGAVSPVGQLTAISSSSSAGALSAISSTSSMGDGGLSAVSSSSSIGLREDDVQDIVLTLKPDDPLRLELEKARSVVEFASSAIDLSRPDVRQMAFYAAYQEALSKYEKLKVEAKKKCSTVEAGKDGRRAKQSEKGKPGTKFKDRKAVSSSASSPMRHESRREEGSRVGRSKRDNGDNNNESSSSRHSSSNVRSISDRHMPPPNYRSSHSRRSPRSPPRPASSSSRGASKKRSSGRHSPIAASPISSDELASPERGSSPTSSSRRFPRRSPSDRDTSASKRPSSRLSPISSPETVSSSNSWILNQRRSSEPSDASPTRPVSPSKAQISSEDLTVSIALAVPASKDDVDIDFLEASARDGLPLPEKDVGKYFSNFGELAWIHPAADKSFVAFKFTDSSSNSMALDFNHRFEKREIQLLPKKKGPVSASASRRSASRSSGPASIQPDGPLSTPQDLARYIDQLANSVNL